MLWRVAAGALALLAAAGCGPSPSPAGAGPGPAAASPSRTKVASPAADRFRSPRTYDAVALPVRLRIPAAGVDTPLESLGRAADRTIELPARPEHAGWFDGGPRPGEPGPSVIIGHVSWDGPAVFARLKELDAGAPVHVDRADGTTVTFRVTRTKQVAKSDFPTDEVYAPDLAPSLKLITCGGPYDAANRNFLDNVIVFATPA